MKTFRMLALTAAFVIATLVQASAQPVNVSVATDGTVGNEPSMSPAMSGDGRFVAFVSFASNLVAGDTNGVADIFLRDRDTDADGVFDEAGAVSTVRIGPAGAEPNGGSGSPAITPDGRYVIFSSLSSNLLAPGQPPLSVVQIFRWDRVSGQAVLVSQSTAGAMLDGQCSSAVVTADGNTVYFVTQATNVDGASVGNSGLVVRRDIAAATLQRISPAFASGGPSAFHADSPAVSDDGRVVAYAIDDGTSAATRTGGTITVLRDGTPIAAYRGVEPRLSRDGRFLVGIDPGASAGPMFRVHLDSGARRQMFAFPASTEGVSFSATGRFVTASGLFLDLQYSGVLQALSGDLFAFDATDSQLAYAATFGTPDSQLHVFAAPMAFVLDPDGDGLESPWRSVFFSGVSGDLGPDGDPDGDGFTNLQEFERGSHPAGTFANYLAEGVSSPDFFTTEFAIVNPDLLPVAAAVRLERGGALDTVKQGFVIPGRSRATLNSHELGLDTSSFATAIESDKRLIVDRLVTWGAPGGVPYGSHAETASRGPATQWFLAEGTTVLGFQLFYLLQNPQPAPVTATVRFLLPSGAPLVRTYDLPARSRTTIYVNTIPELAATDVSADISAPQPIAVERAMYRNTGGQVFALGHAAAAVPATATTWYFAEGATGSFFDTYLLIANPSPAPVDVQVEYFKDAGGVVTQTVTVAANSRFSIFVDAVPGLESANFGARVTAATGVVAERAMYWAGGFFDYYEGHVSAGATATGSLWYLAQCEVGGPRGAESYVLITNTSASPSRFGVHLISDTGALTPYHQFFTLPGHTRISLQMSAFPGQTPSTPPPSGRFGVEILEDGTAEAALVVEGAIYWSLPGQPFAAGANWPGTPVP